MNLREQLRNLLPDLLPDDPADAIKGTELIRLVRLRLGDGYSDATLRYHFSILSYDPTSPIAKVDQGQGYYQRQKKLSGSNGIIRQSFFDDASEGDQAWSRYLRLVAIYERLCLLRGHYPFLLNRTSSGAPSMEGEWDVPDLVVAEWDLDPAAEDTVARTFEITGIGADYAFDAVGRASLIQAAVGATRNGGTSVLVGAAPIEDSIQIAPAALFTIAEKKMLGCALGSCNSLREIPRLLALWKAGRLDLERLITKRRPIGEINQAMDDLRAGRGIRTVLSCQS